MKKILLGVVGVVVLAVVGLLVCGALQPDTFHVERSTSIAAGPDVIFPVMSDFHNFEKWSPWEKLDPAMKKEFTGSGVGSTYSWSGNDDVGEGKMTMTNVVPNQRLDVQLDFVKPWKSTNTTSWVLTADGSNTRIVWSMDGNKGGLMGKTMMMFMNMDKAVGGDFERGLSQLKTVAEADQAKKAAEVAAAAAAATPTPAPVPAAKPAKKTK